MMSDVGCHQLSRLRILYFVAEIIRILYFLFQFDFRRVFDLVLCTLISEY